MRRWIMLFLCMAFVSVSICAYAEYSRGYLVQPPQEVLDHVARSFSGYTLEDYCEVQDTPKGDYGFAMLTAGDERVLVGYEEKDGKMTYWLKNHGAVPQGGAYAWFESRKKGEAFYDQENELQLADGLAFKAIVTDGESYRKFTAYRWEDDGFKLTSYRDWDKFYGDVSVSEGRLHFANWLEGWDFGKVSGTVQRDIRYVSYPALSKTIDEARDKLSSAPDLPRGVLQTTKVKFTGGQKYPVYTGPGTQYARSGNGKGSVSTNDWIQVFGEYNGWILIQYDISATQYRIGWIEKGALPKGTQVNTLNLSQLEKPYNTAADCDCELTDDPLNSQKTIAQIPKGTQMTELIYRAFDGWSYICVTIDGKTMCGFVPSTAPIHG